MTPVAAERVKSRAMILTYHAVEECSAAADPDHLAVSQRSFDRQIAVLTGRATSTDLASATREPLSRHHVAVTFDDGFASVLHNALPILRRRGIRATAFVSTGLLADETTTGQPLSYLTPGELRVLAEHMDIGSHGHEHLDLSRVSTDEVERDLRRSREILSEILGAAPPFLAWPYGRSSEAAREVARSLGFEAAFATERYAGDSFARERVEIFPQDGSLLFAIKRHGLYGPFRRSRAVALTEPILGRLSRMRPRK